MKQEGSGNFILLPRLTWYPNNGGTQFGDRAGFDMKFRYPKKYTMIGVGELVEPEKIRRRFENRSLDDKRRRDGGRRF